MYVDDMQLTEILITIENSVRKSGLTQTYAKGLNVQQSDMHIAGADCNNYCPMGHNSGLFEIRINWEGHRYEPVRLRCQPVENIAKEIKNKQTNE